ncbi:MAG TPA: DUF4180 domain-containing protein [Saprospirales bacterium]|nr:DUF4180 domain-containing protein [Saprospirales bacterium]
MELIIDKILIGDSYIAEVKTDECIINKLQDSLDLIGNVYYDGMDMLIMYQHQITPDFFVLKNKLAGEILQKFSNYRIKLAIVGQFSELSQQSKSLRNFMLESNKGNLVRFVSSKQEAMQFFKKK